MSLDKSVPWHGLICWKCNHFFLTDLAKGELVPCPACGEMVWVRVIMPTIPPSEDRVDPTDPR